MRGLEQPVQGAPALALMMPSVSVERRKARASSARAALPPHTPAQQCVGFNSLNATRLLGREGTAAAEGGPRTACAPQPVPKHSCHSSPPVAAQGERRPRRLPAPAAGGQRRRPLRRLARLKLSGARCQHSWLSWAVAGLQGVAAAASAGVRDPAALKTPQGRAGSPLGPFTSRGRAGRAGTTNKQHKLPNARPLPTPTPACLSSAETGMPRFTLRHSRPLPA